MATKLTDETGSTEVFEHTCDTCGNQDVEAVGFCRQCEQYLCDKCRQCHERSKISRSHTIVGKKDFGETSNKVGLFERKCVPVSVKTITQKPVDVWECSSKSGIVIAIKHHDSCDRIKIMGNELDLVKEVFLELNNCNAAICLSNENDEVLLTIPKSQEVKKFSIKDERMNFVTFFKTSAKCWGIAEFDNGFAVSVNMQMGYSMPEWQVQYLDANGKIKKQICYDRQDKPLFSKPDILSSNQAHDVLYVLDREKEIGIALNATGDVLFKFAHTYLKSPMAMSVDDEDNMYVACTDRVIQIQKGGGRQKILLQKSLADSNIANVCFNSNSQSLIVVDDSGSAKTFSFQ